MTGEDREGGRRDTACRSLSGGLQLLQVTFYGGWFCAADHRGSGRRTTLTPVKTVFYDDSPVMFDAPDHSTREESICICQIVQRAGNSYRCPGNRENRSFGDFQTQDTSFYDYGNMFNWNTGTPALLSKK